MNHISSRKAVRRRKEKREREQNYSSKMYVVVSRELQFTAAKESCEAIRYNSENFKVKATIHQ